MEVASFCSLPVGALVWRAPEPMLSVVVKATFSIASDGEAALAELQEPLRLDEPMGEIDAAGLRYASDFAPRRPRADVTLVGHAHAAAPSREIHARATIDVFDKVFVARATEPAARIPLVPRHLRASGAASAPAIAV
ncbi:MAG TPA: DUF2169 domain-containing protein, partial [Minicystis sp.]|nr:DUF2169 domain-containing protein [Minicystis sp.]